MQSARTNMQNVWTNMQSVDKSSKSAPGGVSRLGGFGNYEYLYSDNNY